MPAEQNIEIQNLLEMMTKLKASDLHITAGSPPVFRITGELRPVDCPSLSPHQTREAMLSITPESKRVIFDEVGTADFSFSIPNVARYRINIFHQRGSIAIAARHVSNVIPTASELHLPECVLNIADANRGMVLVTGITGSGKSSTISAMIHHINCTRRTHIITIEDPIEALHQHQKSIVNQIELGVDVRDVMTALKHALRQDPDVILFGELRDRDSVKIALTATETGHLVFATLHTAGARQTIHRILNLFEANEEGLLLQELASHLRAIISQRLIKASDKKTRYPACEILINIPIVSKLISENRVDDLDQAIRNGEEGMQTFLMALAAMVKQEKITIDEAYKYTEDHAALRRAIKGRVSGGDAMGIIG